ncbi:MAG TPA: polysaccharide deacetylase family protein [Chryseosolibacter sp.]
MNTVLLSFDIEEFDIPAEYGAAISIEEQIRISTAGTNQILDLLERERIRCTFFSTIVFAEGAQAVIQRIIQSGHELASHGWYHSSFREDHLLTSRKRLESLSGKPVFGFRMPRMQPVSDRALVDAGYTYNASLNPVFLPGRYNNLHRNRTITFENGITQVPASATPRLRIPLFWLTFHNSPLALYYRLCKQTMRADGCLNLYFHPWEFENMKEPSIRMPWIIKNNSGQAMVERFSKLVLWMKHNNFRFTTISEYLTELQFRAISLGF